MLKLMIILDDEKMKIESACGEAKAFNICVVTPYVLHFIIKEIVCLIYLPYF